MQDRFRWWDCMVSWVSCGCHCGRLPKYACCMFISHLFWLIKILPCKNRMGVWVENRKGTHYLDKYTHWVSSMDHGRYDTAPPDTAPLTRSCLVLLGWALVDGARTETKLEIIFWQHVSSITSPYQVGNSLTWMSSCRWGPNRNQVGNNILIACIKDHISIPTEFSSFNTGIQPYNDGNPLCLHLSIKLAEWYLV